MSSEKNASYLEDVQNKNRAMVLREIYKQPATTRTEIAKATQLNRATVTNITADLIQFGLIKEGKALTQTRGRHPVPLVFSDECYRIVGVRIARTYFLVGLFGLSGQEYAHEKIDFQPDTQPTQRLEVIIKTLEKWENPKEYTLLGMGVTMPGPVLFEGKPPAVVANFEGWEKVEIRKRISQHFRVPVRVEQDANAAALVEWYQRAMYEESIVYIDAGQGVGAGVVIQGKLLKGASGGAGEIGHMTLDPQGPVCPCGSRGCLDQYCSSILLLQSLDKQVPLTGKEKKWTLQQAFCAYNEGQEEVLHLVKQHAYYLGIGIANLVNIFSPHIVVVDGEFSGFGDRYLQEVKKVISQFALPALYANTTVAFSATEKSSPAFAGANLVLHSLMDDPACFLSFLSKIMD